MLKTARGLARTVAAVLLPLEPSCAGLRCFLSSAPAAEASHPGAFVPVPPSKFLHHEYPEQYASIPVVHASYRSETGLPTGTWASRKLRIRGFVTGALESLPFQQAPRLLVYPHSEIRTIFDQWGDSFPNQICHLRIIPLEEMQGLMQLNAARDALFAKGWTPTVLESYQVLPRRLQLSNTMRDLLNVTVMHCPDDRIVHCKVQITPLNADESPCVKRGGSPLVTLQRVTVRSAATNIPLVLHVDCAKLESGEAIRARDLQLAEGQHLVGLQEDTVVLRMEGGKRPVSRVG